MKDRKERPKTVKKMDFSSSSFSKIDKKNEDLLELKRIYEKIQEKQELTDSQIMDFIKKKEIAIPTSIFTKKIGSLETVCKYLKENLNLKNKEISKLTGKSSKSVWQACSKAQEKHPEKVKVFPSKYFFPASILKNNKLSVLENIVSYLKEDLNLSFSVIAKVLKRDNRTIWTVYQRARGKNAKK